MKRVLACIIAALAVMGLWYVLTDPSQAPEIKMSQETVAILHEWNQDWEPSLNTHTVQLSKGPKGDVLVTVHKGKREVARQWLNEKSIGSFHRGSMSAWVEFGDRRISFLLPQSYWWPPA